MIKLMLTAPFIAMKHVLPHMKRQRFGRIINMASINGLVGFAGKAAYNSAKHGVIGLPQRRLLEVNEVAEYALYLDGEHAGGITGKPSSSTEVIPPNNAVYFVSFSKSTYFSSPGTRI